MNRTLGRWSTYPAWSGPAKYNGTEDEARRRAARRTAVGGLGRDAGHRRLHLTRHHSQPTRFGPANRRWLGIGRCRRLAGCDRCAEAGQIGQDQGKLAQWGPRAPALTQDRAAVFSRVLRVLLALLALGNALCGLCEWVRLRPARARRWSLALDNPLTTVR